MLKQTRIKLGREGKEEFIVGPVTTFEIAPLLPVNIKEGEAGVESPRDGRDEELSWRLQSQAECVRR